MEKFYIEQLRNEKYNEFSQLTQGHLTSTEYKKKFDELAHLTPDLISTNKIRAARFEGGLFPEILLGMDEGGFKDYEQSYEMTCIITRAVKRKK